MSHNTTEKIPFRNLSNPVGTNNSRRIRITSDRLQVKFAIDTPDDWTGHTGQALVLDSNEADLIFGYPITSADLVYIDPPIFGLDSTSVYDA